eukprot:842718_1
MTQTRQIRFSYKFTMDILQGINCRTFIPKHISQVVSGFTREAEDLLPDTAYYHVIDPIVYLCTEYYAIDPMEEVQQMQSMKQDIRDFYDKLDVEDGGDIDLYEFKQGMQIQNISMNETQMERLFNIMDFDQSGYLDCNDFVSFLSTKWQNVELTHLQQPILNKIGHHKVASCAPVHNPIDWYDRKMVEQMELEMAQIINFGPQQMDDFDRKMTDHEIELEIERQHENSKTFGAVERCQEWNEFEVCWYLDTLGFSNCVMRFEIATQRIDGDILLNDLDEELLITELGMKRTEALRLLKEINRLNSCINIEECHQVTGLCYVNDRKLHENNQWNEAKKWIVEKRAFYEKEEQKCMDILQRLTVEHSTLEQSVRPQMKQMMDEMNRINLKIAQNDKLMNGNRYQEELNFCKQNLNELENILVHTNNIRKEVQNRMYQIGELKIALNTQLSNETFL